MTHITLYIYHNGVRQNVLFLTQDVIKIGKLKSSHVCLDDEAVARMHAVIEISGDEVRVIDLGSATGCLVNSESVGKNALLHHGDVLDVGPFRIYVQFNHRPFKCPLPDKSRPGVLIDGFHCDEHPNLIPANQVQGLAWVDGFAMELATPFSLVGHAIEKRLVGDIEKTFLVKISLDRWETEREKAKAAKKPTPTVLEETEDSATRIQDLITAQGLGEYGNFLKELLGIGEAEEPKPTQSSPGTELGLQTDPTKTSNAQSPQVGDCWTATVDGSKTIVVVTHIDYSGNLRQIQGFVGGREFDEYEKFFAAWLHSMMATPLTPIKNAVTPINKG